MDYSFLEIAKIELDDSFKYYESLQRGLGYRFVNEVKECIDRILLFPKAWQQITTHTRRCLLKNFPYGVIYQIQKEQILIVAIANLHKKPNYWEDRL